MDGFALLFLKILARHGVNKVGGMEYLLRRALLAYAIPALSNFVGAA
jgi:hypothetical protein